MGRQPYWRARCTAWGVYVSVHTCVFMLMLLNSNFFSIHLLTFLPLPSLPLPSCHGPVPLLYRAGYWGLLLFWLLVGVFVAIPLILFFTPFWESPLGFRERGVCVWGCLVNYVYIVHFVQMLVAADCDVVCHTISECTGIWSGCRAGVSDMSSELEICLCGFFSFSQ